MNEDNFDPVERPQHYAWIEGIECLEVAKHFNFNLGNVIKYVWRCGPGSRNGHRKKVEDLRKARQYLESEIERLEAEGMVLGIAPECRCYWSLESNRNAGHRARKS